MRVKWQIRAFETTLIVIGIAIGVSGFMIVRELLPRHKSFKWDAPHEKPVSVDTPPLASLSRDQWPEYGLDAVERGLSWGQCEVCGFPVTTEDVRHGFGKGVEFMHHGTYWEVFVCYRHVNKVLSSHRTDFNRQKL